MANRDPRGYHELVRELVRELEGERKRERELELELERERERQRERERERERHELELVLDKYKAMFDIAREQHLVVATLIATVTFAAAFTLPGGVIQEESSSYKGTAILSRNSAFQAFVISDTIAMVFSLSAVFVHFLLTLKPFQKYDFFYAYAFICTLIAMAAMVIAFITGTYAMLVTTLWLAVVTCIIGASFFLFLTFLFLFVFLYVGFAKFVDAAADMVPK